MSAIGTKRTFLVAAHMSAFGGKADTAFCENPLSRSLLRVKRTSVVALHMSAFDPKRTLAPFQRCCLIRYDALSEPRGRQ